MVTSFCKLILKLCHWEISGQLPLTSKFIIIVAPHTSNWDFIIGVLARGALGEKINFLGKHQLFIKPWGWFFKAIGGTPVDRTKHNNLVQAAVAQFNEKKEYKLALTPEGTRSSVMRWKTGFYHIAKQAHVPIISIGFDFEKRQIIIGDCILTGDDMVQDMNNIINYFRNIKGKYPKDIPSFKTE